MKQGNLKFELPTIEELFIPSCTTETVRKIPIDKISEFKNHPFKVKDDDEMFIYLKNEIEGWVMKEIDKIAFIIFKDLYEKHLVK